MSNDDGNVLDMGIKQMDSRHTTPEHTLRAALEAIRKGQRKEAKMVILFLDDSPGEFGVYYYQAGMRNDQAALLCEAGKQMFLKRLGF